jgi:hypothetical protein
MYMDLIELRGNNWVPRRKVEKALTLEVIRKGSKKRRDNRLERLLKLTTSEAATIVEVETTTVTTVAAEAAAAEIVAISVPTRAAMCLQAPIVLVNPSL